MRYLLALALMYSAVTGLAVTPLPGPATVVPASASPAAVDVLLPLGVEAVKLEESAMRCMQSVEDKDKNKADINAAILLVRNCMPISYLRQAKTAAGVAKSEMEALRRLPLSPNTKVAAFLDLSSSSLDTSLKNAASHNSARLIDTLGIITAMGSALANELEKNFFTSARRQLVNEGLDKRNTGFMGRLLAMQALFIWPGVPISGMAFRRASIHAGYCSGSD